MDLYSSKIEVLFINLASTRKVYGQSNAPTAPTYPNLTLATLAGNLSKDAKPQLLDLDLEIKPEKALLEALNNSPPDIAVITVLTATVDTGFKTARLIRKCSPKTKIAVGGVHATTYPMDFNNPELFDVVILGEGDFALNDIIKGSLPPNAFYTSDDNTTALQAMRYHNNKKGNDFIDMDRLSFPDWSIFDLKRYSLPHLISRKRHAGLIETSRGCMGNCNFCNKNIFGKIYRGKNAGYVSDEFFYMRDMGFEEIHVADDSFSQNLERAKKIFEILIQKGFDLPISLYSGVRVDRVDREFFKLAKRAGVWSVSFGIESGNQKILKKVSKGTRLPKIQEAVKMATNEGLETFGFFMLGLSGETEETMKDTIEFSKKLPLGIAKFDICVPLPGTRYFDELDSKGHILTKDWSKYVFHQTDTLLYRHPNISWNLLTKYYKKAHRAFYLRPGYIARRILRDIKKYDIFNDIELLLKSIPSLLKSH